MDLPPELRARIYDFAVPNTIVKVHWKSVSERRDTAIYRTTMTMLYSQPALTRVSKQLRIETLPLFYDHSWFVFAIDSQADAADLAMLRWLKALSPKSRSLMCMMDVECDERLLGALKDGLRWVFGIKDGDSLRGRVRAGLRSRGKGMGSKGGDRMTLTLTFPLENES